MFSFFNKKEPLQQVVLILDIGSGSVGGALVLLRKNRNPKLIYSVRKQMRFSEKLDIKNFRNSMLGSLNFVVSEISKKGITHLNFLKITNKEIKKVYCFFSSPWYASGSRTIKIEKDSLFTVSEKNLNDLVEKEKETFIKNDLENYLGKDTVIMDDKIIRLKLNGYTVDNFKNKKVNSFEADMFMSAISRDLSDMVEKSVFAYFPSAKVKSHSFSLPVFLSLRDIDSQNNDFIFTDISGEVTEVSLVRDGVLKEVVSFPVGKNFFIRELFTKMNLSKSGVESMFNLIASGHLDNDSLKKIKSSISDSKKVWLNGFEKSLINLSGGSAVPRKVYISSGRGIGPIIKDILESASFTKVMILGYGGDFDISLVASSHLFNTVDFGNLPEKDVFLALESYFINRLGIFNNSQDK